MMEVENTGTQCWHVKVAAIWSAASSSAWDAVRMVIYHAFAWNSLWVAGSVQFVLSELLVNIQPVKTNSVDKCGEEVCLCRSLHGDQE